MTRFRIRTVGLPLVYFTHRVSDPSSEVGDSAKQIERKARVRATFTTFIVAGPSSDSLLSERGYHSRIFVIASIG